MPTESSGTSGLSRLDTHDHIEVLHNQIRRHSHPGGIGSEAFEQAAA